MKKHLKLLILLLSVALIVGALAVVAGASDAEQPDKVALYQGDALQTSDLSFDSAIAAIQANPTASDSYTIKLLGNNYVWSDSVFGAEFTAATTVNIDLNGWELNCELTTTVFTATNANVTVNVIGSGSIVFGSALAVATDGATININSTGYGIDIYSASEVSNVIAATGGYVSIRNASISMEETKEVGPTTEGYADKVWADPNRAYLTGSLMTVSNAGKVVFENSEFVYDVAFLKKEGAASLADAGAADKTFATVRDSAQLVIKNTYVKTATSGVSFVETTGAAYAGLDEANNYSFVMDDSTLLCINDNPTTVEYIKARNSSATSALRHWLFKFNTNNVVCQGDVYIKDSYTGSTWKVINGPKDGENKNLVHDAENPYVITFDNSTYEYAEQIFNTLGLNSTQNGEGFLGFGASYINFINRSRLMLNGLQLKGFGGDENRAGTGLYTGNNEGIYENGTYVIDFADGTRIDVEGFANVDLPAGAKFVYDPRFDADCPYVITTEASPLVAHGITKNGSKVRPFYTYEYDKQALGRDDVIYLNMLNAEEVMAKDDYDGALTLDETTGNYVGTTMVTYTDGSKYDNVYSQTLTFNADGTIQIANTTSQFSPLSGDYWCPEQGAPAGKVAVYNVDFYTTDNTIPFAFTLCTRGSGPNINGQFSLKIDGTGSKGSVVPNQWNTYTAVINLETKTVYYYVNGVMLGQYTNNAMTRAQEMRIELGKDVKYNPDAEIYFSNLHKYLLADFSAETFNADDYVRIDNAQPVASVGQIQFFDVNAALSYAAEVDGYVNLLANVENAQIITAGRVKTNGYTFTYETFMDTEASEAGVTFIMTDAVNNSWYLGTAEDPAADTDKFVSRPTGRGEAIVLPSNAVVANVKGENVLFTHKGWATTYVRPVGMTKAEYDAAVAELTVITDFSTVMADMPTTYYPVYDSYATVDYTWYIGSAADPAADTANMVTETFIVGNALTVPKGASVQNSNVATTFYAFRGWATTYVRPSYDSADAYNAAIEGIEIVDIAAMTAETGAIFYPVYEVSSAAFSIITANGTETFYGPNDDLNRKWGEGLNYATVKLYADYTITDQYLAGGDGDTSSHSSPNDHYCRNTKYVDLNGHTLSISCGNWAYVLDGKLYVYSSQPGGKLVDTRPANESASEGFCQVYGNGALFQIGAYNSYPGSNVTVEAKRLAVVNNSAPRADATPAGVVIDGAVVINTGASKHNGMIWLAHTNKAVQGITIKNATVINAVAGSTLVQIPYKGSALFENCDFINIAGGCSVLGNSCSAESEIKFNNCRIGATVGTSNGTVNVDSDCVFAGLPTGATTAEGYVVAYDNFSMDMPALLGTSYSFSYVNFATQEVINVTVTEDMMPDINYVITTADNTTTYNWTFGGETVYSIVAVTYTDLSGLYAQATAACEPTELNVIKLVADGEWVLDDETATLTCGTKVGGIKSGLGAVTVTMHEGFGVKFYIEAETYAYLDAESQAKFTAVTKDEMELYVMVVGDVDVNEAFTNLTFSVKFVEEEYEYVANYRVNLADYIGASLSMLPAEDNSKAMAYYIAAYLNNAYAYFEENDADEEKLAALAAMVEANKNLYNAEAVARPTVGEAIDANGAIDIAVDLTSTPAWVINSTIGGTVNFNGKDYTIVAGEELVINASVLDFDNVLAFALEGDVTGTYCLGNYAAYVAAAESIEGLDEAGLASLKALVAAFYDYVIYAENFR